MLTINSKQRMLLQLRGKKADDGYKRKKLKTINNVSNDSPAPQPSEMEIEDTEGIENISCSFKIYILIIFKINDVNIFMEYV